MKPSFEVKGGATYRAYIDPTVIECIPPNVNKQQQNLQSVHYIDSMVQTIGPDPISTAFIDSLIAEGWTEAELEKYLSKPLSDSIPEKENPDEIDEVLSVGIFPNPTDGFTSISVIVGQAQQISVMIYNAQGHLACEVESNPRYPAGTHEFQANLHDLPSGVYFVVVQAGDRVIRKALTLTK